MIWIKAEKRRFSIVEAGRAITHAMSAACGPHGRAGFAARVRTPRRGGRASVERSVWIDDAGVGVPLADAGGRVFAGRIHALKTATPSRPRAARASRNIDAV